MVGALNVTVAVIVVSCPSAPLAVNVYVVFTVGLTIWFPVHATLAGPDPSLSVHVDPFVTFQASVEDPPTSINAGVAVNDVIDVSTHLLVPVSHPHDPVVHTPQSPTAVHPHAPETHAVPVAIPAQLPQAVPASPHAVGSLVPLTHVFAVLQQPVLQIGFVEQSAEHLPPSQELFAGHWLESVQPQAFPTQTWPFASLVQSLHMMPAVPHDPVRVSSVAHVVPLQHVPTHVSVAEHAEVHVFLVASLAVSHAV
jgi:hypothetical protein